MRASLKKLENMGFDGFYIQILGSYYLVIGGWGPLNYLIYYENFVSFAGPFFVICPLKSECQESVDFKFQSNVFRVLFFRILFQRLGLVKILYHQYCSNLKTKKKRYLLQIQASYNLKFI